MTERPWEPPIRPPRTTPADGPPAGGGRRRALAVAAGVVTAMVVAFAVGALLAGDGGDDDRAAPGPVRPSVTPSVTPSLTPSPSPSASPVPSPSATDAQGRLVDGTDLGVVRGLPSGRLELDRVIFLTGPEAAAEAERRGEPADTDYYVVNDNDLVRSYPVRPDARVTLSVPLSGKDTTDPVVTDLAGLAEALDAQSDRGGLLFDVVVRAGVVVEVRHRYLP